MAKNYSQSIANAIDDFFVQDDWKYEPIDESGIFRTGIKLSCKVMNARIYIDVKDAGFSVISVIPLNANDNQQAVAEFVTRANYGMYIGNFEMDFSDGEIRYKTTHFCGDQLPTFTQIKQMVYVNISMLERYGDGLMKVMFGMASAEDAIREIEG